MCDVSTRQRGQNCSLNGAGLFSSAGDRTGRLNAFQNACLEGDL